MVAVSTMRQRSSTADVGIAVGAGPDVPAEAGDIFLVRSDPRDVARILALEQGDLDGKVAPDLWSTAGYNIFAVPLAAGVLAPWGAVLPTAPGAVLMSLSTSFGHQRTAADEREWDDRRRHRHKELTQLAVNA
jgi:hypothetical protein